MIILHSSFATVSFGHGGEKRSAQIRQILSAGNFDLTYVTDIKSQKINRSYGRKLLSVWFALEIKVSMFKFKRFIEIARDFYTYSQFFNFHPGGLLIWEPDSKQDYHVPLIAKKCGWRVIALPQNLESLVPGQFSTISNRPSPRWFDEEILALSQCDLVVAISREEQWLLRLYGVHTDYLPYYPSSQVLESFQKVDRIREQNENLDEVRRYVLLGTFGNFPTRLGMVDLINEISRNLSALEQIIEIHVVGYGTENLKEFVDLNELIKVHGGVSQSELELLLISAHGVIAHQPSTTGSLTKIPEMLLAGLPVLLNVNAARSWHNCSGVFVYDSFEELFELMTKRLTVEKKPPPPASHINRFIKKIAEFSVDV